MISVFNALPLIAGISAATVNPTVTVAATAAAETANEIIWILQAGS